MDTFLGPWLSAPEQKQSRRFGLYETRKSITKKHNRDKVLSSFASLFRHFAKRMIEKAKYNKRKLWKNLKLSAFVVGAAPWLIPDPAWTSENELTNSEGKN